MSSPSPTVSVLTPAYNSAAFLRRAIDSALAQTVAPLEILVIDDGSSDNTAAVAESYGPPVTVLRRANGGPAAARNLGARHARGEWLAFLDADDAWLPHKLQRQIPAAFDARVGVVFSRTTDPLPHDTPPQPLTFDDLWRHNFVGTSTTMIRRDLFVDAGGFDEDRAIIGVEDYNLWLRLAARGVRFCFIPEELVEYTPAPGNLSSNFRKIVRCALANVDKVAAVLNLPADRVRAKQAAIYEEYGLALLHARDLAGARDCFWQVLARRREWKTMVRWMATFAPQRLLDLRRRLLEPRAGGLT